MAELAIVAQETRIAFDFQLVPVLALIAGILILIFPNTLNYIVAIWLIAFAVIELFNIRI